MKEYHLISPQDQVFSVLIPSVFPTQIRNGASGFVRACGIILSSCGPFITIWFFNYFSVTWCMVAQALVYLIRIPLTMGLKASTAPEDNTMEKDGTHEFEVTTGGSFD